jgi:hypothetical protein
MSHSEILEARLSGKNPSWEMINFALNATRLVELDLQAERASRRALQQEHLEKIQTLETELETEKYVAEEALLWLAGEITDTPEVLRTHILKDRNKP